MSSFLCNKNPEECAAGPLKHLSLGQLCAFCVKRIKPCIQKNVESEEFMRKALELGF